MKNRSRIEITSLILEIANGGGIRMTKIMNKALLSYKTLKQYMMLLTERNLLWYDKETQTFKTKEKGLRFLKILNLLDDMIKTLSQQQQQQQQQPPRP